MKLGQQGSTRKAERKLQARKAGPTPIAAHRAFAPLLGTWGALLGGLPVMVLPSAAVVDVLSGTLLGTWGTGAQVLLAGGTSVLLGGGLLGLGLHWHSRVRKGNFASSVAQAAVRGVTPINPARDLGTRSLDDPLETMPFTTPAWRDADLVTPAPHPAPEAEPGPALETVPQELDLAAFAQLPGRNAVWVEELEPTTEVAAPEPEVEFELSVEHEVALSAQPEPARPAAAPRLRAVTPPPVEPLPPLPGTAALSRLRSVPPGDLSLAQMVERFAGALHEHRNAPRPAGIDPADLAAREAALAEALRALAALSDTVSAPTSGTPKEEPLRAALAQLQPRRGAA